MMPRRSFIHSVAIVGALSLLAQARGGGQTASTRYTLTELSGITTGYDVNAFGEAAADFERISAFAGTASIFRPYFCAASGCTQITTSGTAKALNDAGVVVGQDLGTAHAFRYDHGALTDLGTFGGPNSAARGINFAAQIVGFAQTTASTSEAFLYSNGSMASLGCCDGLALNNWGDVLLLGSADGRTPYQSMLFAGGITTPVSPFFRVDVTKINDSGQIAGTSYQTNPQGEAAIIFHGAVTPLGTLGRRDSSNNYSRAAGLNSDGDIVGTSTVPGDSHAFLYHAGTLIDLHNVTPIPSGSTLTGASAIDDSGVILATLGDNQTYQSKAVLLTPTTASMPKVRRQPESVSIAAGSSITFSTVASGIPLPAYRWQMSADGGSTWTDIAEGNGFTGTATAFLRITNASTTQSGARVRAVASNSAGSETTAAAQLTVTAAAVAPTISVQPSTNVAAINGDATFTVTADGTAPLSYQWSRDGTPIVGAIHRTLFIPNVQSAHRANYTVRVSNAAGAVTSNAATIITASFSPSSLQFVAGRSSATGPVTSTSAPQDVAVSFNGASPAWSATSDQPWVKLTNAAGTGSGRFTVAIDGATLPSGATSATATITLTAPGLTFTTSIPVTVTIQSAASTAGPFGAFDTPASSSSVSGSVAVTGWALDDVGVDRVEIWRDLASGETTAPFSSTPSDPRNGKVFIANATFVPGARPDIEASYPTYPGSSRAGWGYLMLTYGLWNRGNGNFVLYAFAFDRDSHVTTLGTKAIVSNNAAATRPFGAIDTPDQGASVSGTITNFGWALTPGTTCTVAGGSVQVSIDSGALQPVTYGGARSDIAAAFPGYTDANAAGGSYTLDTTTISNGVHTIGWFVTDSCGRADGVGSRFFTVANSGVRASALAPPEARARAWTPIATRRNDGAWTAIAPTTTGNHLVTVAQNERLELQIPARGALDGRSIVNGVVRPLPIGSSIDGDRFHWQPAPGFLGPFDLEFVDAAGTLTRVRVVVIAP